MSRRDAICVDFAITLKLTPKTLMSRSKANLLNAEKKRVREHTIMYREVRGMLRNDVDVGKNTPSEHLSVFNKKNQRLSRLQVESQRA